MAKKPHPIPYWTTRQLAQHFGVSHVTVAQWIKDGKLPEPYLHPNGVSTYWLSKDLPLRRG
jgi:hypothetical protein